MKWYTIASLAPVILITVASVAGGAWSYVALISVTAVVYAMDRLADVSLTVRDDDTADRQARRLSVALALAHFVVLASVVRALSSASGLTLAQAVALALAAGLFLGQVSNANAHELIHRPTRALRRLGVAIYASMLFGHHASAHPRVHHVWVATDRDPNSARAGETFYHFWPRAWLGSFAEGWRSETRLRQTRGAGWIAHPYLGYAAGSLATGLAAYVLGGWPGVAVWVGLAIYAQMQLMLSDYVQHYGLRRRSTNDGTIEPVGPQHAWNAAPWFSGAMMLNAPRHSDHHLNPLRQFPALRLEDQMPMLPASFPVMGAVALIPPLWRRIMDPRLARWAGASGAGQTNLSD